MRKSFKYRCYPNKQTKENAIRAFRVFGNVWSNAVSERAKGYLEWRDAVWREKQKIETETGIALSEKEAKALGRSIKDKRYFPTFYDQYRLIRKREHPQYADYNAQSLQNVLHKVDGSFKSFLSHVRNGNPNARPPNQKKYHRCISYRQTGWRLEGHILYLKYIGRFRIRMHRPIEGRIKLVSVTEKNGRWYVSFSCEANEFSRACGPVAAPKCRVLRHLRQEHSLSGGDHPENAGAHNSGRIATSRPFGGDHPENAGAHNPVPDAEFPEAGGSHPETTGAHNYEQECTHREILKNQIGLVRMTAKGGNHPENEITLTFHFVGGLFLSDSEGYTVDHPHFYFTGIDRLRRLSRNLSRKQYKSKNWEKAKHTMAKYQEHLERKRQYFLWELSRFYAANYIKIRIPKWPLSRKIQYAVESRTAQRMCDAAYGRFVEMLKHKCNEYHTTLIQERNEQWEQQISQLTEVAKREKLSKILRRAKRAVKRNFLMPIVSLKRDCERLTTLRI